MKEVYVHFSAIEGTGFRTLHEGDHVEFEVKPSTRSAPRGRSRHEDLNFPRPDTPRGPMSRIGPRRFDSAVRAGSARRRLRHRPSIVDPMLESLLKSVFGDKHERDQRRVQPIVDEINRSYELLRDLSDDAAAGEDRRIPRPARSGGGGHHGDQRERKQAEREALDDLLPEAFAAVKEACRRLCGPVVGRGRPRRCTWDMVPYDVQLDRRHHAPRGQASPRWRPAKARRWSPPCRSISTRSPGAAPTW